MAETISNLQLAGVRVLVLTGNEQETSINIDYSSNLLADDMADEPHIVDGYRAEKVTRQLIGHRWPIEDFQGFQVFSSRAGSPTWTCEILKINLFLTASAIRGTG